MTAAELQKALDTAGSMTGDANAFHRDIQSRALVSIVALLEAGAQRGAPVGTQAKVQAQALNIMRKATLEVLAPFYRLMKANEASDTQPLKPEMVVAQVGAVVLTGEHIKNAADMYAELWAGR
jgi:hypothetical protein